jgi:hypothetical protein
MKSSKKLPFSSLPKKKAEDLVGILKSMPKMTAKKDNSDLLNLVSRRRAEMRKDEEGEEE